MATLVNPRFILVQSVSNKKQFYYLVLMDLPADTSTYPNPSAILPVLDGEDLIYTTSDYELPEDYDGATITYLLKPFMVISEDESTPNIKSITFQAKTTKKKGDTGGVLGKQIYVDPNKEKVSTRDNSNEYVCKDRCFVIQSDTNTETYFVGTLVDYPSDVVPGVKTHLKNGNELEIERVQGRNDNLSILAYSDEPSTYQPNATPPTATFIAIFVNGYNTSTQKGIFIDSNIGIDLYANAWQPAYGTVNAI